MTLTGLTEEQLNEIRDRHIQKTPPYQSPTWKRHAAIRWRIYNAEIGLNGRFNKKERK